MLQTPLTSKWELVSDADNENVSNGVHSTLASLPGGIDGRAVDPIPEWKRDAMKGNGEAMLYLGRCYEEGMLGLSVNMKQAVRWYRASADTGNPHGLDALGTCYCFGSGVGKNVSSVLVTLSSQGLPIS